MEGTLTHVAVLLIVRMRYRLEAGGGMPETIGFALGECSHGPHSVDIMDADFFDSTLLVIAFRSQADGEREVISSRGQLIDWA